MDTKNVVTATPRRKLVASGRITRYERFMRDLFDRADRPQHGVRVDAAVDRAHPMPRVECGE